MSPPPANTLLPWFVVVLIAFAATACTDRRQARRADEPAVTAEPRKIGVMTGTASQGAEEFRAADETGRRYARRVMHITYPDNFPRESVTVVAQLVGLADESKVGSIVIGQAIPGSVAASRRIRAIRRDLLLGLVAPTEDSDSVADACDLAIGPDELARAEIIVATARRMGARSLVHYSFPRHLSEPLLARQREMLRAECARRGMKFSSVPAPDPATENGAARAREFMIQDVPRQLRRQGPETAFYATSQVMQEPLIRALLAARAGYLVEQALPGPSVGYPVALGLELPNGTDAVPDSLHARLRRRIDTLGMSGHFGTWSASVEGVALRAMVALMVGALDHGADVRDSSTVRRYLEAEAHGPVTMRRARPGANYWLILLPHVTY